MAEGLNSGTIKAASPSQIAKTAVSCASEIENSEGRWAADSPAGFSPFSERVMDCSLASPSLVDTNVGSMERFDVRLADPRMAVAVELISVVLAWLGVISLGTSSSAPKGAAGATALA